jgi:heat shock protein HslJ
MNRRSSDRMLALALAASLAGCATTTRTEIASSADSAVLEGTDWRLVAAPGESSLPDVGPGVAILRFEADRFSLGGPCNSHTGGWARSGEQLRLGGEGAAIASTRRMCPPEIMNRETALMQAMMAPLTLGFDGPYLQLRAADGGVWRFDSRPPAANASRERIVQVAGQRAPCTGVARQLCLQVRTQPGAPWELHYGDIKGFDWQMGVEYVLRVRETTVARPPADGSSLRWELIEVLDSSQD